MVNLAILVEQFYLQFCQTKLFEGSWKLTKMVGVQKKPTFPIEKGKH